MSQLQRHPVAVLCALSLALSCSGYEPRAELWPDVDASSILAGGTTGPATTGVGVTTTATTTTTGPGTTGAGGDGIDPTTTSTTTGEGGASTTSGGEGGTGG